MCVKFAPACITHRELLKTLEPYPRSHRLVSSLSPRIAAKRKNHLAIARPNNEATLCDLM